MPFLDADHLGYLLPAARWPELGQFVPAHSREFPYPLWVHAVSNGLGELTTLAPLQHALGLLAGPLLLLAWLSIPLPAPALRPVRAGIGLGLLALSGLVAQTLVYEHTLRPESISQVVLCGLLLGIVWLFPTRREPGSALRFSCGAVLVVFGAALLAHLRPQTLLALPMALAIVAAALWRRGPGGEPVGRVAASALLIPLLLAASLIWIPGRILSEREGPVGRFTSGVLFFWHLDLVLPSLRQDAEDGRLRASDQVLLDDLSAALEQERARHAADGDTRYVARGFSPDHLYHREMGARMRAHFTEAADYNRFALGAFLRAIARDPFGYATKVWTELRMVYRVREPNLLNPGQYFLPARLLEVSRVQVAKSAWWATWDPGRRYATQLEAAIAQDPPERVWLFDSRRLATWFGNLVSGFNTLHLPLLLIATATLGVRREEETSPLAWVFVASAGLGLAIHATAASVLALQLPRYAYAVAPVTIFSASAALLLIVAKLRASLARPPA